MIKRIEVRGWRALKKVHLDLSHFQVIVGPNGSGKSTFFDALLIVRDVLSVGQAESV